MNIIQSSINFIRYFYNKKIFFSIFVIIIFYCLSFLFENYSSEKNIYDFLLEINGLQPLSYLIIPTFIVVLTGYFSHGNVQNYVAIRFQNKMQWYHMNLVSIVLLTISFLFILVVIIIIGTVKNFV